MFYHLTVINHHTPVIWLQFRCLVIALHLQPVAKWPMIIRKSMGKPEGKVANRENEGELKSLGELQEPKSWRFQLHSCSPMKDFSSVHGGNPLMGWRMLRVKGLSARRISDSHETEILPASSLSLHPLNNLRDCLTTATGSSAIKVIARSTYMSISLITTSLNNWDSSPNCGHKSNTTYNNKNNLQTTQLCSN